MAQIQHVAIFCDDTEALARFYTSTFDMWEVKRHSPEGRPDVTAIYVTDGRINLALLPNDGTRPSGINHFGFVVDDKQRVSKLAAANGGTAANYDLPRDGRYAEGYVVDPSGTRVDLSDHGWDVGGGAG